MKKRAYGVLIIVACIAIIIWGLYATVGTVIVRYGGKKITAIVTEVPIECDKYNRIKVLLHGVEQEVTISRSDCREGKYKVGQQVELIKHKDYDEPVWPESHPELVILIVIGILAFTYFNIKKYNKR